MIKTPLKLLIKRLKFFSFNKLYFSDFPKLIKPVKPAPEECCDSSCDVCVLDLYENQVKEYAKELKRRQKYFKLTKEEEEFLKEHEGSKFDVAKSVFEEFEKSLKEK